MSPKSIYNWYGETLRNPKYRWWIILGTLVYLISPLDISPDLIPFLGQIDDVLILTLMVTEITKLIIPKASNNPSSTNNNQENNPNDEKVNTIDVDAVSID